MTDVSSVNSQSPLSNLLYELGYEESPGLVSDEHIPAELELNWREAKDKLQIDAIYFVANAPVIYFKQFEALDQARIIQLHRNVWNQSKVPLLFIVLPNEIRVYNGYDAPQRSNGEFIEPLRLDQKLIEHQETLSLWERLAIFSRKAIDSGAFWKNHGQYFEQGTKANQRLLANLRYIRKQLLHAQPGLAPEYIHSLIGRSIFALYLQDRSVLAVGENGFFAEHIGKSYTRYIDLLDSHEATYTFFETLRTHFDGDMFPVDQVEKAAVTIEHLQMLKKLFTVDSIVGGQMLFFWAYNFEFIPIELISSIYEEFLHQEEGRAEGAYYTPPLLVDFLLNQVSADLYKDQITLLDPACGSGIFLVEAYKRLIEHWRKTHGRKPDTTELIALLTHSIFGVDIKKQALQIAAFSLYLAMLDYIEPKSIWMQVQFPLLIGKNLIESDFFAAHLPLAGRQFDLIIGNPPWMSKLTPSAENYLRAQQYTIGDRQIVQAFLWRAPDFCTPQGQIALLCSSKSLLFNKSRSNGDFRHRFFKTFAVSKIFDFSALRRYLFENATAPTAAIFFRPSQPDPASSIFYAAPKPTPLARSFTSMVIETRDLKQLPLMHIWKNLETSLHHTSSPVAKGQVEQASLFHLEEQTEDPENRGVNIWKVALWGSSYDYLLLQTFNRFPSLKEVRDLRHWETGSGFIRKGPGKTAPPESPWLPGAPYMDAEYLTSYGLDKSKVSYLSEEARHYHRGRRREIFQAPLALFKRGQAQRRPVAAFSDQNCTYSNDVTGIAAPAQDAYYLKALTALLNSDIAQYYLFLTNPSWGVEREEVLTGDLYTLPFPFLEAHASQLATIETLVDALADLTTSSSVFQVETVRQLRQRLEEEIYSCFGLDQQEIQHIQETVQYTISFFNSPVHSPALKHSSPEMRKAYALAYIKSLHFYLEPTGKKLTSEFIDIDNSTSFCGVKFSLKNLAEDVPNIQEREIDQVTRKTLDALKMLSVEKCSETLYLRRNFRIYDQGGTIFYIVKPPECYNWTLGAALSDAEETLAELL
jgi:type I restriction-modification system DNA methylase subunit